MQDFDHAAVESALRTALIDNLGLKPRLAFGPVRAAITGSRISPPLFESIELLGRQSTLARIAAALTELGEPAFLGSSDASRHCARIDAGPCEIVTKQKKPSVPARTSSKIPEQVGKSRSAGWRGRAGCPEPNRRPVRQPPKPRILRAVVERAAATARRRHVPADPAR